MAGRKVYNTEVVATLTRFGWAPGATFGDSMHYDFIQGYNAAVPGGRSMKNMGPRYSPEGDPVPPPAKAAKPAVVAPNSQTVLKPASATAVPKK